MVISDQAKKSIGLTLLVLAILTLAAIFLNPSGKSKRGITKLEWVTDNNPQRDDQIAAFEKLYPNIKVSIDSDNSGVMKVIVQCCAGMGPDMIDHINEYNCQIYHDAGVLRDITEEAASSGFGLDTVAPSVRPMISMKVYSPKKGFEERQFFYPCSVNHTFVLYNKNLFDKYKIPYPEKDITWEKYIEIAKKLTIYESNSLVPDIFGNANVNIRPIIWSKGGELMNKSGTRTMINTKAVVDAVKFYHDLYYKYEIQPTLAQQSGVSGQGGWASGSISWFGSGRLAMYWGARWHLILLRRYIDDQQKLRDKWLKEHPGQEKDAPEVLRIGACLIPRFKDGKRYTTFSARNTGINVKSKKIPQALDFLKFLTSIDYSKIVISGGDSKPGCNDYYRPYLFAPSNSPEYDVDMIGLDSVQYGRITNRSFFINMSKLMSIFDNAVDTVIAYPNYPREDIEELMMKTADKVDRLIFESISRDPKKREIYNALLKQGAEQIKYHYLLK